MRNLLVASIALGLLPAPVASQAPRSLPLVSADLALGLSMYPDRIGDTYYRNTQHTYVRISGAVRLGSKGRIRPVALLDYAGTPIAVGSDAICLFAPDGHSCRQDTDDYGGLSVGLGGRALIGNFLTVGAGAGTAFYEKRGTYIQGELAIQPGRRIGVVLTARHVELHHPAAGRLWIRPVTFGLRIQ